MRNLEGKRLLILAGAGVHSKVVKAAKEMGIYTIVTDYLADSPGKLIADEAWEYSITEVDKIVERCKKEKVDGVLNFCIDPGQKPYQEICERLGLPCYVTKEQVEIMTDKIKFKDFCRRNNVDVIPDYTEEEIINGDAEFPVFIKPNDGRGSRAQAVCYNKDEALIAIAEAKEFSQEGKFVCEKYLQGKQDVSTAFFVVDGEPYLVKFGDRFLGSEEDNLQKQVMCTVLPSSFSSQFVNNVMPRVKKMIKTLDIKYGPVFLQGFVDGETIRYYDPALRMPGGDYDLILKKVTGFDTVKSLIHFALTGETKECFGNPSDSFSLNGGTAVLLTFSVRAGIISEIVGYEEILNSHNVIYGRKIVDIGEKIEKTGDISQRVAAFGLYVPKGESVRENIEEVYSTYKVYDEHGTDMIISKINCNLIEK